MEVVAGVNTFEPAVLQSGTRPGRVFVAVLSLAFASMVMVVNETSSIASYQQDLYKQGLTGFVVADSGADTIISAARCEQLNHIRGVVSAGARGDLISNSLEIPVREVTSGYVRSVYADSTSVAGTVAGTSLAATKHFVEGSGVTVTGENLVIIDAIAEKSARDPRVDGEMLVVTPADFVGARECVVISAVSATRGVEGLLTNWFAPQQTSLSLLAPNLGANSSPYDRFEARSSLAAPLVAGVIAVLVLVGVWCSRRSDFALYRLLGSRFWPLVIGLVLECTLLVLVPSLAGVAFAVALTPVFITGPVFEVVVLAALQFLVVGFSALPTGVMILLTKNPSELIREGT